MTGISPCNTTDATLTATTTEDTNDCQSGLDDIEKLDKLLMRKEAEKREAKLSRLRVEREFHDVLLRFLSEKTPDSIKGILSDHIRLLNDNKASDSGITYSEPDNEEGRHGSGEQNTGADGGKEKMSRKAEKGGKRVKGDNFIYKNIQLAKFGRETCPITEDERDRLRQLLLDVRRVGEPSDDANSQLTDLYGREKRLLDEIDEKLEVMKPLSDAEMELIQKAAKVKSRPCKSTRTKCDLPEPETEGKT